MKRALSLLLALTLCVGLAIPALAAGATSSVTIKIPGLTGLTNEYYDYSDLSASTIKADVSDLTFALTNAPSQYYYLEDEYSASYLFLVPEGCTVTPSLQIGGGEMFAGGGGIGNIGPENPISFENVSSSYWDDEMGYALHSLDFYFYKDSQYISVYFYYLSPEGMLNLNAPGNEYMKADYDYDGIIDGEDGSPSYGYNGAPSYGMGTVITGPDKFGYKLRSTSELAVASGSSSLATVVTGPSSWAVDAANWANTYEDMRIAFDGKWQNNINRREFAMVTVLMVENALGKALQPAPSSTFNDTKDGFVLRAYQAGIVTGTSSATFDPQGSLTREQLAAMLYRAIQYIEQEGGKTVLTRTGTLDGFSDKGQVSSWAADAVAALSANDIMKGTGETTLSPQSTATIEQALVLALRVLDGLK